MTDRHLWIATLGIAGLILARVVLNMVVSPLDSNREALREALAAVPEHASLDDGLNDPQVWTQSIDDSPALWQELVAPAPAAPPPAPTLEEPDVLTMLKTIHVGRAQIGTSKIKIFTPKDPQGIWLEIGETINGCRLTGFDRETAQFSYYWEAGKRNLAVALERE